MHVLVESLYFSEHIFIIYKKGVLKILPKYLFQQSIVRTKRNKRWEMFVSWRWHTIAITIIPVAY